MLGVWGCSGLREALVSALEVAPCSFGMWSLRLEHPLFPGGLQRLLSLLVRRRGGEKPTGSFGRAQG